MSYFAKRDRRASRDEGTILILVLVLIVVASFIVLPLIDYTISVNRASRVEIDKARAVQLAKGGFWVAMSYEEDLYDMCNGGALPSSLSGVSTTCEVIGTARRRPVSEVPHPIAALQADIGDGSAATIPVEITTAGEYVNPNTAAFSDAWLATPDWSRDSEAGKVWLPQLPVKSSGGGIRDTTLSYDPTCRIFFPGTFTTPIVIDGPTYFTSGVYYFTKPITLRNGADVVVGGGGSAVGCTFDFEAIADAASVPNPLNMSGLGGTFVFGEDAKLVVDDSGAGDIRLVMNQRYVAEAEVSVAASSSVSIVAVNGNHAPFDVGDPTDVLASDLLVDGVIAVPRSTVDDPLDDPDDPTDDPFATDSGYLPSVLTPKPTEPDDPTNVVATAWRTGTGGSDGAATVKWDTPNGNGALITQYVVTSTPGGRTCSPPAPTLPDTTLQPSCTITGLTSGSSYAFSVVATNSYGSSSAVNSNFVTPRSSSGALSPQLAAPGAPLNPAFGVAYSDGFEFTWDPPFSDGGSPITRYRVDATDTVSGGVISCDAWWDENSCVAPLTPGASYNVAITAISRYGSPATEYVGAPAGVDGFPADGATPPEPDPVLFTAGSTSAPVQQPAVAGIRTPEPIVDFTMTSGNSVDVKIAGYVVVPQGHIRIDATNPAGKSVEMTGGLAAGQIRLGTAPANLRVTFDNPIAQKTLRIRSTTSGRYTARADAVVKINRSGSLAVNSLVVQ